MFRIDILESQWIVAALVGGTVLVLTMVLTYLAVWRLSPESGENPVPWVLILTYVAMGVFITAYTLVMVFYPPNW